MQPSYPSHPSRQLLYKHYTTSRRGRYGCRGLRYDSTRLDSTRIELNRTTRHDTSCRPHRVFPPVLLSSRAPLQLLEMPVLQLSPPTIVKSMLPQSVSYSRCHVPMRHGQGKQACDSSIYSAGSQSSRHLKLPLLDTSRAGHRRILHQAPKKCPG